VSFKPIPGESGGVVGATWDPARTTLAGPWAAMVEVPARAAVIDVSTSTTARSMTSAPGGPWLPQEGLSFHRLTRPNNLPVTGIQGADPGRRCGINGCARSAPGGPTSAASRDGIQTLVVRTGSPSAAVPAAHGPPIRRALMVDAPLLVARRMTLASVDNNTAAAMMSRPVNKRDRTILMDQPPALGKRRPVIGCAGARRRPPACQTGPPPGRAAEPAPTAASGSGQRRPKSSCRLA